MSESGCIGRIWLLTIGSRPEGWPRSGETQAALPAMASRMPAMKPSSRAMRSPRAAMSRLSFGNVGIVQGSDSIRLVARRMVSMPMNILSGRSGNDSNPIAE